MNSLGRQFPDTLAIRPLSRPPAATIRVPGSKSITNRALILAALSDPIRGSELVGALHSEDTEVMIEALRVLGFRLDIDWTKSVIQVRRGEHACPIPAREADLFVGNSGTSMRLLTALVSLGQGRYRLDGVSRMRERPIEELLCALRHLGAQAWSERQDGYPPVVIEANGLKGGLVRIKGDISSQFLSALLMVAPLASGEVTIEVEGPLVSAPYVMMTVELMRRFGVETETDCSYFHVPSQSWYPSQSFAVEPDASAAGYFLAAAAIGGGEVTVPGIGMGSLQGDARFALILEEMGCKVVRGRSQLRVDASAGVPLRGIDIDMNAMSDCVMTLAAVACFAEGPTTIRNVAHIRHKESDRLQALATELRRIGAGVDELADGLIITPRTLHGATIQTYNDHRMAMSMALIGLRIPGIVLNNPGCVTKTYPGFFEDLERLRC